MKPKAVSYYDVIWPAGIHRAQVELFFIARGGYWTDEKGVQHGQGLLYHVVEFQKLAWPWKLWNRWNLGLMLPAICQGGRIVLFGPSSSWKSTEAVFFMLTMFYAHPNGTTGICSSTTLDSLEGRIWGYVKEFHKKAKKELPGLPGFLIESRQKLLADPKDEEARDLRNGVFGVACKRSGQWQGLEEYVGRKNDVMILCVDEAGFLPIGWLDSLSNLESNEQTYALIMGNLGDIHSSLAKAAEPKLGWDSLPDTDKSRVYETRWFNGRAVQLIGQDSPNLDYPEGKEPFKKLIGRRYIVQAEQNYGKDTPLYHMFVSGKVPRGTMERSVWTMAQALRFGAMEQVIWGHDPIVRLYGLDAAYSGVGGDRTAGAPFAFGKDNKGQWKFAQVGPTKIYTGSDSTSVSHEEAIAMACRSECERYEVPPEHVFYDGTGRSSLTIAFARLWSSKVVPVEFGGPATERPCFTGQRHLYDKRPANLTNRSTTQRAGDPISCREAYDRFVTELYFAVSACIVFEQMRGVSEDTLEEGSRRLWIPWQEKKQKVETKDDMRKRTTRSPDLSDMLAVAIEGARRLGFPLGLSTPMSRSNNWLKFRAQENLEQRQKEALVAL